MKEYPVQGRATKGLRTLGRDVARAGIIAAARVVSEDDDVTIIATNGHVLRARVANLPKGKRMSKESEVMKLKEGDAVASIARLEGKSSLAARLAKETENQEARKDAKQNENREMESAPSAEEEKTDAKSEKAESKKAKGKKKK